MRISLLVVAGLIVVAAAFILLMSGGDVGYTESHAERSSATNPPLPTEIHRAAIEAAADAPIATHESHSEDPPARPWYEDNALFESVSATFAQNFASWVAFSTEDFQWDERGDEALSRTIWKNGGTHPLLQVRVEDFSGLREDEKIQVSYLLGKAGDRGEKLAREGHALVTQNARMDQEESLVNDSLSWPPDALIALYADAPLSEEVAGRIRARRVEMLRSIAPDLAQLDYARRFTLKAAMLHGVDRARFNWDDCALLAPAIAEYELHYKVMCQSFAQFCASELRSR